jgi:hypothetical protein
MSRSLALVLFGFVAAAGPAVAQPMVQMPAPDAPLIVKASAPCRVVDEQTFLAYETTLERLSDIKSVYGINLDLYAPKMVSMNSNDGVATMRNAGLGKVKLYNLDPTKTTFVIYDDPSDFELVFGDAGVECRKAEVKEESHE